MRCASRSVVPALGLLAAAAAVAACGDSDELPDCSEPGSICLWAGDGERGFNIADPEAHRLKSRLYYPVDLTFGPDGRAYINDWNNHRIRRVEPDGALKVVIGTDYEGDGPPEMEDRLPLCNPAGAPAITVAMNHTTDMEFGPDGKLYVASWHNHKIRVYDPATEIMISLTGNQNGFTGDGGPACMALLDQPKAVAVAPDGTIYTVDQRNVRIRAIAPDAQRTITTIAGTGVVGAYGDGGLARDAEFGFDTDISPRPTGSLVLDGPWMYVADSMNHRIRRIHLETGVIDCIAGGSDQAGYAGDGGPALDALFSYPTDIELGPDRKLYIADRDNHVIRAVDLTTGLVETVAGTGTKCDTSRSPCPTSGLALDLPLNEPYGIAFDAAGDLYIADTHNSRILKAPR